MAQTLKPSQPMGEQHPAMAGGDSGEQNNLRASTHLLGFGFFGLFAGPVLVDRRHLT